MKIKFALLISVPVFILCYVPATSIAQPDRSGNHCAVQKSPFRVSMDTGKVVYSNQCLSCHHENGLGMNGINPPLNGKLVTGDKMKLIEFMLNSQHETDTVTNKPDKNSVHGNTVVDDQEVAWVLTYIRNSFGNKASSVKVSEVKSAHRKLY